MKKNLVYTIGSDTMYMSEKGLMEYRVQHVTFTKHVKGGENIVHHVWITLIANLLLMVMQKRIKRTWSFSGLATMYRIMLMYYVNPYSFL